MADGNLGITGIQNYLRMKLFSHDFCEHNCGPNPLEDATRKVTQLIEQSIKERESNSFLIVGPQGVGKSTVNITLAVHNHVSLIRWLTKHYCHLVNSTRTSSTW
jgi:flagellar biosynthesis GTPase FlhF